MINGNCTDINCPERRSVCCDAPCERIIVKGKLKFVCSVCFELFVGGECNAIEKYTKTMKKILPKAVKMANEMQSDYVKNARNNKIHNTGWKQGYTKGRKDAFKQIIKALPETKEIVVKLMERGLRNL